MCVPPLHLRLISGLTSLAIHSYPVGRYNTPSLDSGDLDRRRRPLVAPTHGSSTGVFSTSDDVSISQRELRVEDNKSNNPGHPLRTFLSLRMLVCVLLGCW